MVYCLCKRDNIKNKKGKCMDISKLPEQGIEFKAIFNGKDRKCVFHSINTHNNSIRVVWVDEDNEVGHGIGEEHACSFYLDENKITIQ
jgi:hypothetical protein